jgi:hypothetical protein
MPNALSIIKAHNKRILAEQNNTGLAPTRLCNCMSKARCPLEGKCLTKNVVYEAQVSTVNRTKIYIGSTGNDFKSRYYSHKSSFNHRGNNETELSKYIWNLKDANINFDLTWKILRRIRGGGISARRVCTTCNLEKLEIALADKRKLLNSRSELNNSCPHFRSFYFKRPPRKKPN